MRIIGFLTSRQFLEPTGDFRQGIHILEIEGLKVFVNEEMGEHFDVGDLVLGRTLCIDVRISFKKDKPPSFWAQSLTVQNGSG